MVTSVSASPTVYIATFLVILQELKTAYVFLYVNRPYFQFKSYERFSSSGENRLVDRLSVEHVQTRSFIQSEVAVSCTLTSSRAPSACRARTHTEVVNCCNTNCNSRMWEYVYTERKQAVLQAVNREEHKLTRTHKVADI